MVWQNDDVYFPCARLLINQKMSFETMFLNYKPDFDILIINAFTDESNRYEIKRFMKNIKEVDCFKDKKVIAIHDENAKRVSGVDILVEESNFDDLRKIRLFDNNGKVREDLCMPSLEDYISVCKRYGKVAGKASS